MLGMRLAGAAARQKRPIPPPLLRPGDPLPQVAQTKLLSTICIESAEVHDIGLVRLLRAIAKEGKLCSLAKA